MTTEVGGLITNVRRVTTKNGDTMAFLKLEDFDGTIDVTLFPNVFYKTMNVAQLDDVVVVEGRVDNSSDTFQIFAGTVTAAANYVPDFWLKVPAQIDNPATLDKLKKLFAEHEGNSRINLNRHGEWKRITRKISDSSDLRGELKALLGADNVRLY